MAELTDRFGTMVFSEEVMKDYLPKDIWKRLAATLEDGEPLDLDVANAVAHAMKVWAISKGATHYAHWFQPLSGITSEKHDSFLEPNHDGTAITKFTGKNLIQGEPDASSFPNGGLRATFEARGYTAWDPTSYAFIKDEVLCIPTAFASYTGEALDKKTPLLRSMTALSQQINRMLALFGEEPCKVTTTIGAEQEFFLIPESDYAAREDLVLTGRTLFGFSPCKGQELEEHYFGAIRPTVNNFMKELDDELWALGISAKTKHNEVAPAQHELAPIYTTANRAVDENLLTMEKRRLLAGKYGLACLLHEKPFEGINGSGKHNNWAVSAGNKNLLDPGDNPQDNLRFLVLLTAVIEAVDEYQELLRMSVASAGNDHRLGANEAPPAIISIFLGDELGAIVDALVEDQDYAGSQKIPLDLGVEVLPKFPKDNTDRNRTSPFAFTGNKFEFRMLGSSESISCANTVLNTSVAEELRQFADALEGAADFETALHDLIRKTISEHKRIIFNGDGYDNAWVEEAEKRGLLNLRTTPDALAHLLDPKNIALFKEHNVYNETELTARHEVKLENYCKIVNIEAQTMLDMARKDYLPAMANLTADMSAGISAKLDAVPDLDCSYERDTVKSLSALIGAAHRAAGKLERDLLESKSISDSVELADFFKTTIIDDMAALRISVDSMESIASAEYWPVPSYGQLLFGVR